MAEQLANFDLIDELRLAHEPAPDRLPAMLFLAALIHGVLIIGIGFNPELPEYFAEAISLEVTIVADPDQRIDRPDRAQYLAQASQQGGGNTTDQSRASAPLQSVSPIDNVGDEFGDSFKDARTNEQRADQLLAARAPQDIKVRDDLRQDPQPDRMTAMVLESGRDVTLPLPQEDDATLMIHDDQKRQLIISADTRESNIAAYLDNWKRRVEQTGSEYFPQIATLDGLTGSPTLEVSINASGQLASVVVRKSSGSRVIDKAALDILRRASPFDPFPPEVRAEYDQLRFAYKWLFGTNGVNASASVAANTP